MKKKKESLAVRIDSFFEVAESASMVFFATSLPFFKSIFLTPGATFTFILSVTMTTIAYNFLDPFKSWPALKEGLGGWYVILALLALLFTVSIYLSDKLWKILLPEIKIGIRIIFFSILLYWLF